MPIRVNLDLILVERGMTLSELAERIGINVLRLAASDPCGGGDVGEPRRVQPTRVQPT